MHKQLAHFPKSKNDDRAKIEPLPILNHLRPRPFAAPLLPLLEAPLPEDLGGGPQSFTNCCVLVNVRHGTCDTCYTSGLAADESATRNQHLLH